MTILEEGEQQAVLRGRLRALLSLEADDAAISALRAEAVESLGREDSVSLLIEAVLQQRLSYRRKADESVEEWADLRRRADDSLPSRETTRLLIRSHYIRFLRLRGRPDDLDQAVALRASELAARERELDAQDNLLGIARSDLAVVLIDRVRTTVRSAGAHADPRTDLSKAEDLLDDEIRRRKRMTDGGESLLYGCRLIRSELYVGLAECSDHAERDDHAATAQAIARDLVGFYGARGGCRSLRGLKSRLLLAESFALAGRPSDAARSARLACGISGLVTDNADRGWPQFVLARLLRPVDKAAARLAAARALEEREKIFPEQSYRMIEVRDLIESLG
jgi:hypothetical protein